MRETKGKVGREKHERAAFIKCGKEEGGGTGTGFLEGAMLSEGRQTGADRSERLVVRGEQEVSR